MKRKLARLSQQYATALGWCFKQGPQAARRSALALGQQAAALDLETLDVVRIHEEALATLMAQGGQDGHKRRADQFFGEVITPIEKTHRAAHKDNVRLKKLNAALDRRTADLASSQRSLQQGIVQRKTAQRALRKSVQHSRKLLAESRRLQKHLQRLTHQLLSAQEDKRKQMRRNLHDEIAQTLLGIHVRLLTLGKEVRINAQDLRKEIVSTQRLVDMSLKTIKRSAREFLIQPRT